MNESLERPIPRLPSIQVSKLGSVNVFLSDELLSESDRKELTYWENDPGEGPDGDLFENVIYKSHTMLTFRRALPFMEISGAETVLEIGAGHGWGSIMLKRRYPGCHVVASDVSPHALQLSSKYENLIGAAIDEKWACNVLQLPFAEGQFDMIFCFAAFHHFIIGNRYAPVLAEMLRVLKPNGKIVLLYEPSSAVYFYTLAKLRVNKNRSHSDVDEDLLQMPKLTHAADQLGAKWSFDYFPDYEGRLGFGATVYYWLLSKIPLLCRVLPCTVNVRISKA